MGPEYTHKHREATYKYFLLGLHLVYNEVTSYNFYKYFHGNEIKACGVHFEFIYPDACKTGKLKVPKKIIWETNPL